MVTQQTCFLCKKKLGWIDDKFGKKVLSDSNIPIPEGFEMEDVLCYKCFKSEEARLNKPVQQPLKSQTEFLAKDEEVSSKCNADNIGKKEHKILDKAARILVPEAKYVYDSAKRGTPAKCPRCGKSLPKHSLTCLAKQMANPFYLMGAGIEFSNEAEKAYCSKCNGFLPDHKDGCPLKKK